MSIDQREELWLNVVLGDSSRILLAVENGDLIGFLCYGNCMDKGSDPATAEIMALYVDPTQWRKDIGRILMQECCRRLHSEGYLVVTLWVIIGNVRGTSFFEAMGFQAENGKVK